MNRRPFDTFNPDHVDSSRYELVQSPYTGLPYYRDNLFPLATGKPFNKPFDDFNPKAFDHNRYERHSVGAEDWVYDRATGTSRQASDVEPERQAIGAASFRAALSAIAAIVGFYSLAGIYGCLTRQEPAPPPVASSPYLPSQAPAACHSVLTAIINSCGNPIRDDCQPPVAWRTTWQQNHCQRWLVKG